MIFSLLRGKKAVLAGDHCQLPPTIKCSNRDVQTELGKTLFERLIKAYDSNKSDGANKPSKMLEVQYRMHEDIANWASNAMYNGKLVSHETVRHRKLSALPQVHDKIDTKQAGNVDEDTTSTLQSITLTLIDTTGCGFNENATDAGSRYNEGEAELVVSHVESLLSLGLRPEDIAVITPYNGQVELLRKRLLPDVPKLEIRSVDGFQGGEREAVVLSLVRSSERGGKDGIGFLRDERRLNVAVTRAKRHCAVICDAETVSQDKFIKGLIDWMEEKGDYHSGAELASPNESCAHVTSIGRGMSNEKRPAAANLRKEKNRSETDKAPGTKAEKSQPSPIAMKSIPPLNSKQDALKEGAQRRALLNKISQFSETKKRGDELVLKDLSDFDVVVARELSTQLGLGCDDTNDNMLTLRIDKEVCDNFTSVDTESAHDTNTTKFSQLDMDESSDDDAGANESSSTAQNSLLKDLALERQRRQISQQETQSNAASTVQPKKKSKKKKKGQKLGGEKKQPKEQCDNLDDLDDMAFLDAQIEQVQTSHGRKIEAKGKGYKSIINGVLLTKHDRPEEPKRNKAVSNSLHAKIKAKSEDRQVKKKKGK